MDGEMFTVSNRGSNIGTIIYSNTDDLAGIQVNKVYTSSYYDKMHWSKCMNISAGIIH